MPIPGLDARGVTPELKLRLKFYCSWNWCFFSFLFFVCLLYYCGVFTFIFIPIFFLYYQLYHHYLLIPTLIPFTLPPPVLKSIALLPNYSFYPFSSLFLPGIAFPSHSPPTCQQTTPPTHSPADQPTVPILHNPNPLQSLTQAPYTTKEIHPNTQKGHKTHQPPHCFPYSPTPLPTSPFSATLTNSQNCYS
jgi:hypothetical protein